MLLIRTMNLKTNVLLQFVGDLNYDINSKKRKTICESRMQKKQQIPPTRAT